MDCTTAASAASISPPLTTTLFASSKSPAPLEPVTSAATAFASSRTSTVTAPVLAASISVIASAANVLSVITMSLTSA